MKLKSKRKLRDLKQGKAPANRRGFPNLVFALLGQLAWLNCLGLNSLYQRQDHGPGLTASTHLRTSGVAQQPQRPDQLPGSTTRPALPYMFRRYRPPTS